MTRSAAARSSGADVGQRACRAIADGCATSTPQRRREARRSRPASWRSATRARRAGAGRADVAARSFSASRSASTWIVLPSPMSSARQAPRPRRCEEREPAHADAPGTAAASARSPRGSGRLAQPLGAAQAVERLLRARGPPSPRTTARRRRAAAASPEPTAAPDSRRMPSRKRAPSSARRRLDALPVGEHLAEARRVELDPLAPDQREPGRGDGDARDLRGGQRLAVERDAHVEVEQRVGADPARRARAERDLHLRARRALAPPTSRARARPRPPPRRRGCRGGSRYASPGVQASGWYTSPESTSSRSEGAPRRRDLHGLEQGQELVAVARARVLADRLAERAVLRLALPAEARGCRSRGTRTAPRGRRGSPRGGSARARPRARRRAARAGTPRAGRRTRRARRGTPPLIASQHAASAAVSRYSPPAIGGAPAASAWISASGQRDLQALAARLDLRHRAELRDEGAAQIAPEREAGRQRRVHLGRAEVQEPVPGAPGEGGLDPRAAAGPRGGRRRAPPGARALPDGVRPSARRRPDAGSARRRAPIRTTARAIAACLALAGSHRALRPAIRRRVHRYQEILPPHRACARY